MKNNNLDKIHSKIFTYNEQKVMLDSDLAELYGVATKALNQAVKRNIDKFPPDFMFKIVLSDHNLKSQIVTSGYGGRRKPITAFTEQGVSMLSSVLSSKKAVQVNIQIMRAFVFMRKMSLNYDELNQKIKSLEERYDTQFRHIFEAIHVLISECGN